MQYQILNVTFSMQNMHINNLFLIYTSKRKQKISTYPFLFLFVLLTVRAVPLVIAGQLS